MKLYNSENNSDEDGGNYEEGNLASIICDKEDVEKLKLFFDSVHEYLKTNDFCHMHFRDSFQD